MANLRSLRPLAFVACLALVGCGGPAPAPPAGAAPGAPPPDTAARPQGARDVRRQPAIAIHDEAQDINAKGDVHGDVDAQLRTLKGAGLVAGDGPYTWAGGTATLVVTGDVIDKGSQSLPAIDLFRALETDAASKGGRVIVTSGNHEAAFLAAPDGPKARAFHAELLAAGLDPARVAAGETPYGEWLRTRPFAAVAGDWFFSHAGDAAGRSASHLGDELAARFDAGQFDAIAMDPVLEARKDWWADTGAGDDGVSRLDRVLAALPAAHLVYGHQPGAIPCPGDAAGGRPKATLWTCYDGRVFFVDVGMSRAVDPASRGGLLYIRRGMSTTVTAI
ncbi:MAG: metallophosphoesterase, partial [Vicinamibacterales bacterium]